MSRTFDSFMDEPLDEAPRQIASSARFGKPRRSFDSFMEEPLDVPMPRKKQNWFEESAGNATNAAADFVGGAVQNLKKMGLPTDQFFDSAKKARAQQQAFDPVAGLTSRLVAGSAGALGVGDTLANMVSGPVQQMFRVPPEKRAVSRMKEGFVASAPVQSVRKQAPEFFDQYADTTQAVLPVPGKAGEVVAGTANVLHKVGKNSKAALAAESLAKRMGATGARRMADAVLSQAAIGGGQVISDQMKANEILDAGRIGIGAAVGGLAGGLAGGLEELAGGLATRMTRRPPVAALPEAVPPQSVNMSSRLQSMIDSGHIDPTDADFAELVTAAKPVAPTVDPWAAPSGKEYKYADPRRPLAAGIPGAEAPNAERAVAEIMQQRANAPRPEAPSVPPRKPPVRTNDAGEPVMTLEEFKRMREIENLQKQPWFTRSPREMYLDLSQAPPEVPPVKGDPMDLESHPIVDRALFRAQRAAENAARPQPEPYQLTPQQQQAAAYRQGNQQPSYITEPAPDVVSGEQPPTTLDDFRRQRAAQNAAKRTGDPMDLAPSPEPTPEPPAVTRQRQTADAAYAGGLEQIRTATPDTILESIARAKKAIPAGTPVSIRKERLKQIQDMAEIAEARHIAERASRTPQEIPSEELQARVQEAPKAQADEAANELLSRPVEDALPPPPEPRPVPQAPEPIQGDARAMKIMHEDNSQAMGHDVVDYAPPHTEIQDPVKRGMVEDVAHTKINQKDAEHAYNAYAEALYARLGNGKDPLVIGGDNQTQYVIQPPGTTQELNTAGNARQNELRHDMADTTGKISDARLEAVVDREASDFSTVPPPPKTMQEARHILGLLQQQKTATKAAYDSAKKKLFQAGTEDIKHNVVVDVNGHEVGVKVYHSTEKEGRLFLPDEFKKSNSARKAKGLPPETEEEFYGKYYAEEAKRLGTDVGTIHEWIASLQRKKEGFEKAVADLMNDPALTRTAAVPAKVEGLRGKGSWKVAEEATKAGRKLPPLAAVTRSGLVVGGFGLMSEQGANAEDGTETEANPIFRNVGTLMVAAGLGGKLVKRILSSRAGKQVIMFADTLDHISRIDTKLGLEGAKRLDNIILEGQAKAAQMGWGVHFPSQNEKARALTELADGTVPLANALTNPPPNSALHGMNPEQRQAVVGYFAARKTLGKKIGGYAEAVDAAAARDPKLAAELGEESILRLHNLALDMTRMRPKQADMARRLAYATSSTMDFYFMMNPKHHLLNLTDSIIGGSARLGPGRMAKAWVDMLEPDMQRIFKDANLFGSFKEDRNALGAMAGKKTGHIGEKIEDVFKSDEFNANRVALAGFNQFYDMNKGSLPGYSSYKQFTKDVIQNQGNIPQAMRDAAWAHMLENQMRILGVDPLRANPNWIKNSLGDYGQLVSFVNQPVRMARQLHEMLNKNQFDKLAVFMVAVTALGGEAVIPASLQFLGDSLAPEQMSKAKRIANAMSIPGAITNAVPEAGSYIPSLSSKLQYDPMAPYLFGTTGIAGEGVRTGFTKTVNAAKAINSGAPDQMAKGGYEVAKQAGSLYAAGLPVGEGFRMAEAANKAIQGKGAVYNFDSFNPDPKAKALSPKYELNYDDTASGRMYPLLESLLPGELENTYRYKRSAAERQRFKGPDAQYAFENPFGR